MTFSSVALIVVALAVGALVGSLLVVWRTRDQVAAAAGAQQMAAAATADRDTARAATAQAEAEVRAALARVAGLEARLAAERAARQEAAAAEARLREQTLDQFRGLSATALDELSRRFLVLADQRMATADQAAAGDLARRQEAVAELVRPLGEALGRVSEQVARLERERSAQTAALAEQVRAVEAAGEGLRRETAALVTALRKPQVRGAWGELHLRRSVEVAGMLAHVDFVEQGSVRTDDGLQRPDLVVHLAGGKQVVVDAKVPLSAFLEAAEAVPGAGSPAAGTPAAGLHEPGAPPPADLRADHLRRHAEQVRAHMAGLARKAYWRQFTPTPEFVVMFLPGEAFLAAALEVDPGLLEEGFANRVVLATPSTLVAMLRTVAYAWTQDALAADAQRVLDTGRELAERLDTFGGHLDSVGRSLTASVQAFNKAVGSYDSRLLVSARRLRGLGLAEGEPTLPRGVAEAPRVVSGAAGPEADPRPGQSPDALAAAPAAEDVVPVPRPGTGRRATPAA